MNACKEWISVNDNLPPADDHYQMLSIEVICMDEDGYTFLGFCQLRDGKWFRASSGCPMVSVKYWRIA